MKGRGTFVATCRNLPHSLAGLAYTKAMLGALGIGLLLTGAARVPAAPFLDDFSTDTSATYVFEDSFGMGGSFNIANGTLSITTGNNNTATVTTANPVPFAVGESLGVDVPDVASPEGVFMTLGVGPGQPSGGNAGYRWRRDTNGGTNIRIGREDLGIIIGPSPDPDVSRPATLWIDRIASDTFEFLIQLEGSVSRTSYGTDTYAALDGISNLHIGMQAFDNPGDTFAFDNLRIVDTSSITDIRLKAVVDRDTGGITLHGDPSVPATILGYTITSTRGSLDQAGWTTISGNYDGQGNESVDDDNWVVLAPAGSHTLLAEAELDFDGGDGATLAPGQTVNLSQGGGAWIKGPVEAGDLEFNVLFDNGSVEPIAIEFTGNSGNAFKVGDFNFDGTVNIADWDLFRANHLVDLSGLTIAQAYQVGDLNGDRKNDVMDFALFKAAYDADQGSGAFVAMLHAVPEPSSMILLGLAAVAVVVTRRSRGSQPASHQTSTRQTTPSGGVAMRFGRSYRTIHLGLSALLLVLLTASGSATAAPFLDDFSSDTSANYVSEDSFGSGGSFEISGGTLNITTGNNNTFTVTTANPVPFAVGESLGVDVPDVASPEGVFMTLGVGPGQPSGGNNGYRWRRDTAGGTNLRIQRNDTGIILTGTDPDTTRNATLWIDRLSSDTFEFLIQMEGEFTRTSYGTDTYAALAGVTNLHIGMQAFDNPADTFSFDNLRIVDTSIIENPPTLTLSVNTMTGQTSLLNSSGMSLEVDYYLIESAAGALDKDGWNSLDDQSFDAVVGGDYNSDGNVDAADYTVWRDNLGASIALPNENPAATTPGVVDQEDYEFWKNQFGAGGASGWGEAGGSNQFQLAELTLQSSTFADGASVSLGSAYDPSVIGIGDDGDLTLLIRLASGELLTGDVVYDNSGSGSLVAAAVPEPGTMAVALCGVAGLLTLRRRRGSVRFSFRAATRVVAVVSVAWAVVGSTALATITNDRAYQFGDPGSADATLTPPTVDQAANVGEGNLMGFVFGGTRSTGDDTGPSGAFIDLEVFGATYTSTASRPGASAGDFGARFDGIGNYLRGERLGLPSTSASSMDGGGPLNYAGISDRGLQFWVNPSSAGSGTAQSLVADTLQHGVRISSDGTWVMQYAGATVDSGVDVSFDDWSHVMLVRPSGAAGGAQLYVDGIAVAAAAGGYDGADNTPLVVGANSGTMPGTADFFNGVIDDLEMFVMGTATAAPFNDWGTFDYATDNPIAAAMLTGVAGDVNQDGELTPEDIDDFIAGFFSRNLVNGMPVGDITTIINGDLNLDGITDLNDAFLLHEALIANGMGGLTQFGFSAVPEPRAWTLMALAVVGMAWHCKRRPV